MDIELHIDVAEQKSKLAALQKRIEDLERTFQQFGQHYTDTMLDFERRLVKLEQVRDSDYQIYKESVLNSLTKKPYKCPVCLGKGSINITERTAKGPREHFLKENPCIACHQGKGIVWG